MSELIPDVLQLIFQQLVNDKASLLNISLTCRAWRTLALPCVLQFVDISSHNNGRQPQLECKFRPMVYSDYDGWCRPQNLIPRQRALLQLMTDKPSLARYVKSFAWTLIWWDFDEVYTDSKLEEIDRQTWTVFGRMVNVTHLDLASLHNVVDEDEYIRHQTPRILFPKVKDLRLLGWMHRGLVRAVITSLEPSKLRSLKLDYLEDEGAFPNGDSIGDDIVTRHAYSCCRWDRTVAARSRLKPDAVNGSEIFDDDLIVRQETGIAFVFPGPMWLPLYLLSPHAMVSLTHLQVKVPPWGSDVDVRNYNTLFRQTAMFITNTKETLKSLTIMCALLAVLNDNVFPQLEKVHFEGFQLLKDTSPREAARADLAGVLQSARDTCCRFAGINATLTDIPSVQGRQSYDNYTGETGLDGRFAQILANS